MVLNASSKLPGKLMVVWSTLVFKLVIMRWKIHVDIKPATLLERDSEFVTLHPHDATVPRPHFTIHG